MFEVNMPDPIYSPDLLSGAPTPLLYKPGAADDASAIQSESWITPAPAASPLRPPSAEGRLTFGK